jgi:hypothetical protein
MNPFSTDPDKKPDKACDHAQLVVDAVRVVNQATLRFRCQKCGGTWKLVSADLTPTE